MTDSELLTTVREWLALCELANAQAATLKKTQDARDSKHAEMMFAATKPPQVLR